MYFFSLKKKKGPKKTLTNFAGLRTGTVWLLDMVPGKDLSLLRDLKRELMLLLREELLAGEGVGDSGGWLLSKEETC